MAARSAVIFIPNDAARTGGTRPLMLRRVMGVPLLRWLTGSLQACGIHRWVLVCRDCFAEEEIPATCTGGIALCGVGEVPSMELIERADRAMYRAKRENREMRTQDTDTP